MSNHHSTTPAQTRSELLQHQPQPRASEPIVHLPVTPHGLYDPELLFPEPPEGTDTATAMVMRTQREAYAAACEQLLEVTTRYNALLSETGIPTITGVIRPNSEPPVPL